MSNQGKNKQPKKGFSLARLFQNNRFVLIFSLATAIVLWFIMAVNNTESRARIIDKVPINISLSDELLEQGYQIYETTDSEAQISVTGSNITVNQLSRDDIRVDVDTSDITGAGSYQRNLTASKNSSQTDYTIEQVQPGSVTVFVDKQTEKTLDVETEIQYFAEEGYYAGKPSLSIKKVTISGPETEVSAVSRVAVKNTVEAALKQPYEKTVKLTLYDSNGEEIKDWGHMTLSSEEATVKINVLKKAELNVKPTYKNLPDGLDISSITTITPQTLIVGYQEKAEVNLEDISLAAIDMSEISPYNTTVSVDFEIPKNCTNITGEKTATVKFDLDDYETKTFSVKNFVVRNTAKGTKVTVDTSELQVGIVGPSSKLSSLKASNIDIEVDMTGSETETGSLQVPATVQLDSKYGSWAIGTYSVFVTVTKT